MKPFNTTSQASENQREYWDKKFTESADFFGDEASGFAKNIAALLTKYEVENLLELGSGQGRDTLFFAQNGLSVTALDYSVVATEVLQQKADGLGVGAQLKAQQFDVREPLPFADETFDGCYSHMLLCMELSTEEIAASLREIHRVLKPGGLVLYSVRSNFDPHYRTGEHLSEKMYNVDGFVVHFFTKAKVRQLTKGFELLGVGRLKEGSLPRDLYGVVMTKAETPESWELDPIDPEEEKAEEQYAAIPLERPAGSS